MLKVNDHIFVYVSNAMVYKTIIKDIRIIDCLIEKKYNVKKIEYLVTNNSMDIHKDIWISENRCFAINDIDKILSLDILFEDILEQ